MNKTSLRLGLITSFGMMLFFIINAIGEYRDCSTNWGGMCGLGIVFLSLTYGLVITALLLFPFQLILEKISEQFDISFTPNVDYVITSGFVILIVGFIYFAIGYFLGWIYRKIKNK